MLDEGSRGAHGVLTKKTKKANCWMHLNEIVELPIFFKNKDRERKCRRNEIPETRISRILQFSQQLSFKRSFSVYEYFRMSLVVDNKWSQTTTAC